MGESQDQQSATSQAEKRQHRRATLLTEVKCDSLGWDEVLVTRDVSVGGMFLTTNTPLPLDSQVGLSFSLGIGAPTLSCAGKVVYSKQGMGMGIEFFGLGEVARLTLQKFMDESN